MTDEIKPISLLYMWLLFTRGGEALLRDIRPECKPEYRRPLVSRGLVAEIREGRTKRLSLTDAGWHYLATHMTDSIKTMSAATSAEVLQGMLATVCRYMQGAGINLAELLSPAVTAEPDVVEPTRKAPDSDDELWNRLSRSWRRLQEADDGIRLETLRAECADLPRERLDKALLEWQKQGKIVIYPYDDGERVTPEAKAAALKVNGRELHVIYQK